MLPPAPPVQDVACADGGSQVVVYGQVTDSAAAFCPTKGLTPWAP